MIDIASSLNDAARRLGDQHRVTLNEVIRFVEGDPRVLYESGLIYNHLKKRYEPEPEPHNVEHRVVHDCDECGKTFE